jgi:hypothetical protein
MAKKKTTKKVASAKNRNGIPKSKAAPSAEMPESKKAPKRRLKRKPKPIDWRRSMYADSKAKTFKRQPTLLG